MVKLDCFDRCCAVVAASAAVVVLAGYRNVAAVSASDSSMHQPVRIANEISKISKEFNIYGK